LLPLKFSEFGVRLKTTNCKNMLVKKKHKGSWNLIENIRVIKSRRLRWAGHVLRMEEDTIKVLSKC
jgi:hypothetical protein